MQDCVSALERGQQFVHIAVVADNLGDAAGNSTLRPVKHDDCVWGTSGYRLRHLRNDVSPEETVPAGDDDFHRLVTADTQNAGKLALAAVASATVTADRLWTPTASQPALGVFGAVRPTHRVDLVNRIQQDQFCHICVFLQIR